MISPELFALLDQVQRGLNQITRGLRTFLDTEVAKREKALKEQTQQNTAPNRSDA